MGQEKYTVEELYSLARRFVAKKRIAGPVEDEDLVQEYVLAAWEAGRRADPRGSPRAIQYARGFGGAMDFLRTLSFGPRGDLKKVHLVDAVEMATGRSEEGNPLHQIAEPEADEVPAAVCVALERALRGLPEIERQAMEAYASGMTLQAVGRSLGFSESRASQLLNQARDRMLPELHEYRRGYAARRRKERGMLKQQEVKTWREELSSLDDEEFGQVEDLLVSEARVRLIRRRKEAEKELADLNERLESLGVGPGGEPARPEPKAQAPQASATPKRQPTQRPVKSVGKGSGMSQAILSVLSESGEPMKAAAISLCVEDHGYDAGGADAKKIMNRVGVALPTMRKRGQVEKVEGAKWVLAE